MSADGTIDLAERRLAPCIDVVEELERMLERARAGEIRSVALAFECTGQHTATTYAMGDGDIAHLYLALDRLQLRLLDME